MRMHGDRWWLALCGVSLFVGFVGGYWVSELRHEDQVQAEARRQSDEFLLGSIRLGIVTIDGGRVAELTEKIESEGE